jgi:hypothetical protein
MDVRTLITAEALIVAALLAWAQLWTRTYDIYRAAGDPIWLVSLFLAAIYTAVLASLFSMAFAAWSSATSAERLGRVAIGLAGFSTTITASVVAQSALVAFLKAWAGWTEWHPFWVPSCPSLTTLFAAVIGAVLLLAWVLVSLRYFPPLQRQGKVGQGE